jgi:hypothetical protein
MTHKISETEAVQIALRYVREEKIDGAFNGVYLTEDDCRPCWRVLFELRGVAPEAECLYGEIGVMVDAATGVASSMRNL